MIKGTIKDLSSPKLTAEDQEKIIALYDAEIRQTDDHVASVIEELKAGNLLENTIFIVTSDHGEELWDHGRALLTMN